jgi:acetyltransferase-like isoleucine patch superfamily enzyme
MISSLDKSYFENPLFIYIQWLKSKYRYEKKYRNNFLKIGYMSICNNVTFGKYNWTGKYVAMENVSLGDFSYVSSNSVILEASIGKFCSIGPNVKVAPGKHPTKKFVSTHPALFSNPSYCKKNFFDFDHHNPKRHVTIGNDVWICSNSVIADGITIGDGAIIAANSLVNRDVEPYSIISGVPAQCVRKRFENEEIDFLLQLKWWNKEIKWIEEHAKMFLDIKEMMKYNENDK